ncbi:hypothetical protein M9Y10_000183 [Tritrichomonas musculus]|uniref:AIG1-type G domain-containing protein n=1 Tax=Tritrichomonas musculus TaxID=1915356 RepID=A0ABR2L420_9EUKA
MIKKVTVLSLGESGVGKSTCGCVFLKNKNAFDTDSSPDSCTYKTSSQSSIINGIERHFIDTQGLASPDGLDAAYITQMVDFLKKWENGINAIYIIINIQSPRFDAGVQQMMKMLNKLFNNPNFWNQTAIIFTRCYPGHFDRNSAETRYRNLVIDFIKNLPGCQNINPQVPCFFVDSVNYENDQSTKDEFIRIFEYAHGKDSLQTHEVQPVRPEYQSREEIKMNHVLLNTSYSGSGASRTKTMTYADQRKYKLTDWKGNVTYTQPENIRTWNEVISSTFQQETKVEQKESTQEIFRWESCGGRRFGFCGPRPKRQVHDYYLITTNYTEYLRDIIIDPDGNVTYGDWRHNRDWSNLRTA